jgi:cell division septation protein DedD
VSDAVADAQESPGTSAARVGLTLGGIVLTAVVVFGLGVMEGSRVADLVPSVEAPPSALPTEALKSMPSAPARAAAPIPPDKLTFYDRLSGVAPAAPVALPEGQPPAPGLAPVAAPDLSDSPSPPQAPQSAATAAAAPKKPAVAAAATTRTATAAKPAAPPKPDPAAQIRKLSGKGRFSVQMAAVSERSAAAETAALIKRNGFDAVTVMASVKGKVLYRIRVGSFPSKQAAAEAAGIFRSAYGLNAIPVEN